MLDCPARHGWYPCPYLVRRDPAGIVRQRTILPESQPDDTMIANVVGMERLMSDQDKFDTIVIGGGFAGVSACRDLADQGYDVLLLEARNRLGGRTWSENLRIGDYTGVVERGGQFIWPERQQHIMAEIERYGLTLAYAPAPRSYPTLLDGHHNTGPLPVPLDEIYDFERASFQILTDAARITRGIPLDRQDLDDLDDITFAEYLDNLKVGPATRGFFTFLSSFFTGRYPDEVSALPPLLLVAQMDYSLIRAWGSFDVYIEEGTSALVDAMAADSGADVRLETSVTSVFQAEEGVAVTTHDGHVFSAQTVVMATPVACWSAIDFHPPLNEVKRTTSIGRNIAFSTKVHAQIKNAPSMPFMLPDATTTQGAFAVFPEHELGEDGQMLTGFYIVHPDRERFSTDFAGVQSFYQELFPGCELVDFDCQDWTDEQWSGYGGWVAYPPGIISKSHSVLTMPEGRLFFATSDIATGFMCWIEGAVEMGKKAAVDAQHKMTREAK
jgi:monoamine oxidase